MMRTSGIKRHTTSLFTIPKSGIAIEKNMRTAKKHNPLMNRRVPGRITPVFIFYTTLYKRKHFFLKKYILRISVLNGL